MVRSLTFLLAMMCAAAIGAAQTPQTPPSTNPPPAGQPAPTSQQPSEPSGRMTTGNAVTYSGCVKPGTTAGTWILDNADVTAKAGAGQAGASTQAAQSTVGTSGTKTTLDLTAKPSIDFKAHANHKVEVTGTLAPATGPAPSGPATGQASSSHREFTVETLKMVSSTCP
jgi:hypothetical protein